MLVAHSSHSVDMGGVDVITVVSAEHILILDPARKHLAAPFFYNFVKDRSCDNSCNTEAVLIRVLQTRRHAVC